MFKFMTGFESGVLAHEVAAAYQAGTGGICAISSTNSRTGSYCARIHSAPDGSNYFECTYNGTTDVLTLPSKWFKLVSIQNSGQGDCAILECVNFSAAVNGTVAITDAGQLKLLDGVIGGTQRGSNSPTLSLDTWYCLQMQVNHGATNELTARLFDANGNLLWIAVGAMTTATNAQTVYFGAIDWVTGLEMYIDDVFINTTDANDYPNPLLKLVMARPTGAGDNAATAGTASSINEVPVTDTVTSSANRIELDNNPTVAEYEMTNSSDLGIAADDTIEVVSTMIRIREEANATTNYRPRLKSASGGTTQLGTAVDAGNTTLRTNPNGTNVANHFSNALISTTDPTTGLAWTPTGTNSINSMQMGVGTTTANDIWIAWMGAYIGYVPKPDKVYIRSKQEFNTAADQVIERIYAGDTVVFVGLPSDGDTTHRGVDAPFTVGGVNMTAVVSSVSAGGQNNQVDIYVLKNAAAGINVTWANKYHAGMPGFKGALYVLRGADVSSQPDDSDSVSNTSGANPTLSLDATLTGGLLIEGIASNNAPTAGSSQTVDYTGSGNGSNFAIAHKEAPTATNYSEGWTVSSGAHAYGAVLVKYAYGVSGGPAFDAKKASQFLGFMS